MPAHRKPTALHALSGALDHDPKRFAERIGEPRETRPIGDPPARLTSEQVAAWNEIATAAPRGVIGYADRIALELMAVLLARFWTDGANMPAALVARLDGLLGRFAMTPADRSRAKANESPAGNAFAERGRRPS